jgi:hypothetical protein
MTRLLDERAGRVRSCLESQFGGIADRNSCRNGWTQSLDMRASCGRTCRPLQRRLTISLDFRNVLTGLDQVINGRDNMRGWGEGQRADANLLEVRGFDPVANRFIYEVNEGFGQTRRGPNAFRNAFSITLSGRIAVGGQPHDEQPRLRHHGIRAASAAWALDRMLANPLPVLLDLRETLAMTPDQVARIEKISTDLAVSLAERREVLGRRFDNVQGQQQARIFQELQPEIEKTRTEVSNALRAVERILTPEQWRQVPEQIRNPFQPQIRRGPGGRG